MDYLKLNFWLRGGGSSCPWSGHPLPAAALNFPAGTGSAGMLEVAWRSDQGCKNLSNPPSLLLNPNYFIIPT